MTQHTAETPLDRACVRDTPEMRRARVLRLVQRTATDDFRLLTIIRMGVCDFNRIVEEVTDSALGILYSDTCLNMRFDYLRRDLIRIGAIWQTVNNRVAIGYSGGSRAALLPKGLRVIHVCTEIFGDAALGGFAPLANEAPRIIR